MKIAIICPYDLPVPAVLGGAVETLVEQLIKNNEINIKADITIFSKKNPAAEHASNKYSNTKFKYLNFSRRSKLYYYLNAIFRKFNMSFRLSPCIMQINKNDLEEFDVVIVENDINCILPLRNKYSRKLLLHLHSDSLNTSTKDAVKIIDSCDLILAVSNFIKKRIQEIKKNANVKVFYNVVDIDVFRKKMKNVQLLKDLGFNENDTVIGFCGRLTSAKGIDKLMQACENIFSNGKIKILIIGSCNFGSNNIDSFTKSLIDSAKKLGENSVVFSGYVQHKNIPSYINLCDFLVVPSQCNEALPLVVLEGMASGLPVIGSKIGGIPELIQDDMLVTTDIDFVDNLEEKIKLLMVNHCLREKISGENLAKARADFSSMNYLDKLVELIETK